MILRFGTRWNFLFGLKLMPPTGLEALLRRFSEFGEFESFLVDVHSSGYAQAVFLDFVQDGGVGQA